MCPGLESNQQLSFLRRVSLPLDYKDIKFIALRLVSEIAFNCNVNVHRCIGRGQNQRYHGESNSNLSRDRRASYHLTMVTISPDGFEPTISDFKSDIYAV